MDELRSLKREESTMGMSRSGEVTEEMEEGQGRPEVGIGEN